MIRNFLFWFTSFAIGIVSLRFLLVGLDQGFPNMIHQLGQWRFWFVLHVSTGPLALMLTPFQLSKKFRNRNLKRHRILGRVYAGLILVSGIAGLVIAFNAKGGLPTRVGFGLLAVFWLTVTANAILHARAGRIVRHREWMIRSAALTFAGVTLRLWLMTGTAAGLPFETVVYPMSAWLCWTPNLVVAELVICRSASYADLSSGRQ